MRVFGSLNNRIMEAATRGQPVPEVGMGATMTSYSDRFAGTVVAVASPVLILVQADKATRIDKNGMSDCQSYDYAPNPEGGKSWFKFNGKRWVQVVKNPETGRWKKRGTLGLGIGYRDHHHDFCF